MIQLLEKGNELSITRKVEADGTIVKGVYVEASDPTPFTIKASVQPKTGIELMALPKGEREKIHLDVITLTELKLHDEFTFGGKEFDVQTVQKYYKHFEVLAVEKKI